MIVVDTSALIDSLTGSQRSATRLRSFIERGERLVIPSVVLYEWLRGPRVRQELLIQEELFSGDEVLPFTAAEAAVAAKLYREIGSPRGREIDLAIAAMALVNGAALWTLNDSDFEDIPGLELV